MAAPESSKIPLHPIEKSLLQSLASQDVPTSWTPLQSVLQKSALSIDQVRRAVEWLKAKRLIEIREEQRLTYTLGSKGRLVISQGLPERRLLKELENSNGRQKLPKLANVLGDEFSVALGRAKKNGWISISDGQEAVLRRERGLQKEPEESLLDKIHELGSVGPDDLSSEEKETMSVLAKRQKDLIQEKLEKNLELRLTPSGRESVKNLVEGEIDEITPQVIRSGEWREHPLRSIDVTAPSPNNFGGRKHPIRMFIEEVREAFLSLGFEEISGPIVQSAFWNFDALFIPQHHSAREMQDTFYLQSMKSDLSFFESEIDSVRHSHETGGETGSLGWGYHWNLDEAKRVVLRTHTTAVTIKYLSDNKPADARVFSLGRVYRNEKPNYKHNPEFNQIEGVMVGPRLNLRNLIFVISKFYSKLGFDKIKFWPTFFPYTEPSLQTVVYLQKKQKWMELGGMGVFRPEVTIPLGIKNPVLAWGLGLDRLVMLRYDIEDVRELFGSNLRWLRNAKVL